MAMSHGSVRHSGGHVLLCQGINMYQTGGTTAIKLRLRPAGRPNNFYGFEVVLGSMLHELSHIVHRHHQPPFWKFLDELTRVGGGSRRLGCVGQILPRQQSLHQIQT